MHDAETAAFAHEVDQYFSGSPRPTALLAAFRAARFLVPVVEPGAVVTVPYREIAWIPAFRDTRELGLWLDGKDPAAVCSGCREVVGARILDEYVPALGRPAGVAVDIAGTRPMFLPPVAGIVPDAAVVCARGSREASDD